MLITFYVRTSMLLLLLLLLPPPPPYHRTIVSFGDNAGHIYIFCCCAAFPCAAGAVCAAADVTADRCGLTVPWHAHRTWAHMHLHIAHYTRTYMQYKCTALYGCQRNNRFTSFGFHYTVFGQCSNVNYTPVKTNCQPIIKCYSNTLHD